ncbi:MAG: DsbA family protein [Rhodospirillaceae bacterium]
MFRTRLAVAAFALLISSLVLPVSGFADSATFSGAQKSEIERLVHDYLVKNPEVLVEAMTELRARQQQAENDSARKALVEHHAELVADAKAPLAGNPRGDVTVVEFFDYSCPYCKSVEDALKALIKADDKVRVVLKEFPVLGAGSVLAAKAALASRAQGKYAAFHEALMTNRGQFSEESVMRIAKSAGLDTERLKADMAAPEIEAMLSANASLAEALNIRGTPAFVIGDQLFPGVIELRVMKQAVAEARKSKG